MENKIFENSLNYTPKQGEINDSPSLTVPEMTLSLKQLLERYTRGQSVATLTPVYLGEDEEFAQFDNLDRLEKMQIAKDNAEQIQHLRNNLREEKAHDVQSKSSQIANSSEGPSGSAVGAPAEKASSKPAEKASSKPDKNGKSNEST